MAIPALYPREPSSGCLSTIGTLSLVSSAANLWLKNTLLKKKFNARSPRLWQHQGGSTVHLDHKRHQTNECLAGQIEVSQ